MWRNCICIWDILLLSLFNNYKQKCHWNYIFYAVNHTCILAHTIIYSKFRFRIFYRYISYRYSQFKYIIIYFGIGIVIHEKANKKCIQIASKLTNESLKIDLWPNGEGHCTIKLRLSTLFYCQCTRKGFTVDYVLSLLLFISLCICVLLLLCFMWMGETFI